jgi:uncharacterized protein YjbJ (UPF0337 family)
MDKDTVKGKLTDVGGRIERQAGEWTGNEKMQGEGAANQVKGKIQNTVGKVKDAGRDAKDKLDREMHRDDTRHDEDRDRNAA